MKAPSEEIYSKSTQGTQCWNTQSVGFNARCWQYRSIFIRLAAVDSQSQICEIREILRKLELIAVQGHPRSLILVPIESAYATFY